MTSIDLIIPKNVCGGAENVAIKLANELSHEFSEIRIIYLNQKDTQGFYPVEEKVKTEAPTRSNKLCVLAFLIKLYYKSKPNYTICFLDIAIFYGIILKLIFKINLIISERNNPFRRKGNAFIDAINPKLYFLADKIVLQTKAISKTFSSTLNKKIEIIPNPIFEPNQFWKISSLQNKQIIAIGRLEHQKGFDVLINAFSIIVKEYSEWKLTIIGRGSQKGKLLNQIKELNLGHCIQLIDVALNVNKYLVQSSIYVLSSRYEGFPNTLLEAQACGIPCIATNCEFGPGEIIKNNYNGLVIETESVSAIVLAFKHLISSRSLIEYFSKNSIESSKEYYIEKVLKEWMHLLSNKTPL